MRWNFWRNKTTRGSTLASMEDLDDLEYKSLTCEAVSTGNLDSLKELVEAYGLSYVEDWDDGLFLLCTALRNKKREVAKYLISKGANLHHTPNHDHDYHFFDNPLNIATLHRDTEIVEQLLEAGALVSGDLQDYYSATPMWIAVCCISEEIMSLLLQYGANPNSRMKGEGILHKAVASGLKEMVDLLLKAGACSTTECKGNTPVRLAINRKHWDILSSLLDYKAEVTNEMLGPAMSFDAMTEYDEMLKVFAEYKLAPNVLPGDSDNIMFNAIRDGNIQVLEEMLKDSDMLDMVRHTSEQVTPLHVATFYEQSTIAKLLISCGANILAKDGWESTPVDYVMKNEDLAMLTMFLESGESLREVYLLQAIMHNLPEFVKFILQHDANVFYKDKDNNTPLHVACREGHKECVALLLEFGSDPNAEGESQKTPLHLTASINVTGIVNLLFDFGADININDDAEMTPLTQEVKLLLDCMPLDTTVEFKLMPLLNHVVKLKTANLFISVKNMEAWEKGMLKGWYDEGFISDCEEEVEAMKKKKIEDCCLSFYDLLSSSKGRVAKLAGNCDLMQALETSGYQDKFPIYSGIIGGKLSVGKINRRNLDQGRSFLHNTFPILPLICIDIILDHLSNEDTQMLTLS